MSATGAPDLSIFPTSIGWFGLVGAGGRLVRILFGHSSADEVREAAQLADERSGEGEPAAESDWHPELRERLVRYAAGEPVAFGDVPLELPPRTPFQARVIEVVRKIPYDRTLSYGDVARQAGFPGAARAVGTVMASNRFPIVIPCHRVLAAAGRLGGYSSPQGTSLKAHLLALEREGVEGPRQRPARR
jgi:methylated-DNA-[protein]-cysteine S-methyltransferase